MPTFDETRSPSPLVRMAVTALTWLVAGIGVAIGLAAVLTPLPLDALLTEAPPVVARSPAPVLHPAHFRP